MCQNPRVPRDEDAREARRRARATAEGFVSRDGAHPPVDVSRLSPDERLKTIYPRYVEEAPVAGPDGLAVLAFRAGTPYQGEDLVYDGTVACRVGARRQRVPTDSACAVAGPGDPQGVTDPRDALVRNKRAAGRPKDMIDVEDLTRGS